MPRTLAIFFPDRQTEYWLTERVFSVGDKFDRNGDVWIVTSIGETKGHEKHMSVTVRPDDNSPRA